MIYIIIQNSLIRTTDNHEKKLDFFQKPRDIF